MKARKDEVFTVIAFCTFLGVMMLLFLFGSKDNFSELEKRYLAEPPQVTWEHISSGKFSQEAETYMADHLPGRDFFVGLNAYAELWTGRQIGKDIYSTWDGRLVEAPVQWNEAAINKNMSTINRFAMALDMDVNLILAPSAGWAVSDHISGPEVTYQDEQIIRSIYDAAGSHVKPLDLVSIYKNTADPSQLYYRTDHHWTSLGAWHAYKAFCDAVGKDASDQTDFRVETISGFHGSTYSRSALWLTRPDNLELWHGSKNITVTNGESNTVNQGPFYRDRLEELDKYTVFLDGNHSLVRLHNPEGSGTLLVVRDSYSNCLGAFLAESYENVILVDLRYYKMPVSELIRQEGVEEVLVCYSLSNFLSDTNIVWLR